MYNIIDHIPVDNNLAITIDGICDLKPGTSLIDENGKVFTLISTGVTRYKNAKDIKKYTDILVCPNINIGKTLYLNDCQRL